MDEFTEGEFIRIDAEKDPARSSLLDQNYNDKFSQPTGFYILINQGHVVVRLVTKTRLSGGDHGYSTFVRKQSVIALIISVAVKDSATFPEAQDHEIVVYH